MRSASPRWTSSLPNASSEYKLALHARLAQSDVRSWPTLCESVTESAVKSSPVRAQGPSVSRFMGAADRSQSTLLPETIDQYVCEENPFRVIDAFVWKSLHLHAKTSVRIASILPQISPCRTPGFLGILGRARDACVIHGCLSRDQGFLQRRRASNATSPVDCPRRMHAADTPRSSPAAIGWHYRQALQPPDGVRTHRRCGVDERARFQGGARRARRPPTCFCHG